MKIDWIISVIVITEMLLAACSVTKKPIATEQAGLSPLVSPQNSPIRPLTKSSYIYYRGYSTYGEEMPSFEITYDSQKWLMTWDETSNGPQLTHKTIPACSFVLREGAREYRVEVQIQLAGLTWHIADFQPNYQVYYTFVGRGSFIFGLRLPESVQEDLRHMCRSQMEEILATFQIME